jgi:hypothetical protein
MIKQHFSEGYKLEEQMSCLDFSLTLDFAL